MSDTEKAALERRIDELCVELGHAQLNRDMWHDRAEDMRNRLLAEQTENDKLREKVQRQADELTSLRKAIEQRNGEWRPWKSQAERLVAENAKLRELCETFGMIANDAICDYYDRDELLARANVDARELGVEL